MTKTSYITGEASVVFGGAINIGIGYNPKENKVGLFFSEIKEQLNVGDDPKGKEMYEPQVQFIFDSIGSIKILRRALDLVERTLKDGKIPMEGDDG